MLGNCYIYQMDVPGQAAIPTGDELVCPGGMNDYSTTGATDAESYVWALSPAEAGIITGTTEDATVQWDADFTGNAEITVQGINDCGDGIFSDALVVAVENLLPEITGDEFVYQNTTHVYSSEDRAGATYNWTVDGGIIDAGRDFKCS